MTVTMPDEMSDEEGQGPDLRPKEPAGGNRLRSVAWITGSRLAAAAPEVTVPALTEATRPAAALNLTFARFAAALLVAATAIPQIPGTVLLVAAVWIAFAVSRSGTGDLRLGQIDAAGFALLICACVSTPFAGYRPAASTIVGVWITAAAAFYAVRRGLGSTAFLLAAAAAASLCLSALGLGAFVGTYRQWRSLGFTSLNDFHSYVRPLPASVHLGDVNAVFLLSLGLAWLGGERPGRRALGIVYSLAAFGCFLCLLLSFSRAVYLALLLGVLAAILTTRLRAALLRAGAVAAVAIAAVSLCAPPIGRAMLDTMLALKRPSQQRSAVGRLAMEQANAKLIALHPLLGVGPGNLVRARAALFPGSADAWALTRPHNTLVATAAETGVPGALCLGALAAAVGLTLWRMRKRNPAPTAFVFAFVATGVYAQFEDFLTDGRVASIALGLMLGLLAAEVPSPRRSPQWRHAWLLPGLSLCLVAAMVLPSMLDVEIRNTQIGRLVADRREWRRNTSLLRTPFHTRDSYVDFANLVQAQPSMGLPRDWHDLFAGNSVTTAINSDRVQSARDSWHRYTGEAPGDDGGWANEGRLSAALGERDRALTEIERATRIRPENASYRALLGFVQETGQSQGASRTQAIATYANALALQPQLAMSALWHEFLARDPAAAAESLTAAIDEEQRGYGSSVDPIHRDAVHGERLARLLWLAGREDEAKSVNAQVLASLPALEGAWELRGEMLESADLTESRRCYERAQFLERGDALPTERLTSLALGAHDYRAAARLGIMAFEKSRMSSSRHSLEARAEDGLPRSLPDDDVPGAWPRYTAPLYDFHAVFAELANWFEKQGDPANALLFRRRAERVAP